jgi:hypothetical protein
LIGWRPSCAALTHRDTTLRRNAAACSPFRSAFRRTLRTIMKMLAHGMVIRALHLVPFVAARNPQLAGENGKRGMNIEA